MTVGDRVFKEGDWITLDGTSGQVMAGKVPTVEPKMDENYKKLMGWADDARTLGVWTNADAPEDAEKARSFGAEGIGLCRTEHMFFGEDRLPIVKRMIMNIRDAGIRKECLSELLGMQRQDFYGILKAMKGLPVTIRLLDPPLHEFLPQHSEIIEELTRLSTKGTDQERQTVLRKELKQVESLAEQNPMLGHRGCRLGISYPELYEMQVRAIMEAACELKKEGVEIHPEIMIPLIGTAKELQICRTAAEAIIATVFEEKGIKVDHHIGTMIEIPRAALTSAQIAPYADFYSFGTNDLTQMTFGYSRDDVGKFVPSYVSMGILEGDPFVSVDQTGVGRLMQICVDEGRAVNPKLKIGICGEHGGEDKSVKFCHKLGLNYVSCSPFRVPIARLAAGQAAIMDKKK
jgi:pyruvate,orthophosphate dikinase